MDLKEVCRTCLLPSDFMLSIFSLIQVPNFDVDKVAILEMLKIFTKISVSPNDDLPNNICCDCLDKVCQLYAFKLKCEKSEAILKQLKEDPNEYEQCVQLIKTEKTDDFQIPSDQQLEEKCNLPAIFQHDITNEEFSMIQEIKQEPEIEINVEDGDLNETDLDDKRFKSDLRCPVCTKIFLNKRNLKLHMRVHNEEKPSHCEVRRKKFRFKKNLKIHPKEDCANDSEKNTNFKCAICSRSCFSKYNLTEHMRIHTGEKPFPCQVCSKAFRLKTNLTAHMRTIHERTNSEKFKCSTCSKLLGSKYHLTEHMKMHTGERPFECEVCLTKFRYKHSLKSHMQTAHSDGITNTKSFECTICSKSFGRKYNLTDHMTIHSGEKPFLCEMCPKAFRLKTTLRSHIRTVHETNK